MSSPKKLPENKPFIAKEFDLPETLFVRDIDNRLFQNIVVQCLSKIKDVALVEGSFIDNIFGRSTIEGISGVHADQDSQNQSLTIRIEVNIAYGVSIPEKAEEIQTKIAEEVTRLTGLHVACVHVVFKDLMSNSPQGKPLVRVPVETPADEYSDEFK